MFARNVSSFNPVLHPQEILNIFLKCTFFINPDLLCGGGSSGREIEFLESEVFRNYPVVLLPGNTPMHKVKSTEPICSVGFGYSVNSHPPVTFLFLFIPDTNRFHQLISAPQEFSILSLANSSTSYLVISIPEEFSINHKSDPPVQLFFICPLCPEPLIPVSSKPSRLTLASITHLLARITKNLHGHSILYPDLDILQQISDCGQLGQRFLGEERICTIQSIITKTLNGTLIFAQDSSSPVVGFVRNTLLESLHPWHYEFLPNGYTLEPYTFAIILDKRSGSQFDLNPLDNGTDTAKKLSLALLAVLFGLKMTFCPGGHWAKTPKVKSGRPGRDRRRRKAWTQSARANIDGNNSAGKRYMGIRKLLGRSGSNISEAFIQVVMPLYDQGDAKIGARLALGPSDRAFYLVLIAWLLLSSIVINGSYKGALFSILTHEVPSGTPETLRELVQTLQYPILSSDFRLNSSTHALESILRELIQEQLESGRLSPSDWLMYSTLHDRVQTLAASHGMIIGAYETGLNIANILVPTKTTPTSSPSLSPNAERFEIPKNFAIIGFRSAIHHFVTLMKEFPNVFVLPKPYVDPFLSLKLVTVTSRNAFGQNAFPVPYARIHESGIYRKWAENRERLYLQVDKYVMTCLYLATNPAEAYNSKECQNYERWITGSPFQESKGKQLTMRIILKVGDNVLWPGFFLAGLAFLGEIGITGWKIAKRRWEFRTVMIHVWEFLK